MAITVGTYVANTNPVSPYAGKPGLVVAEPSEVDGELRVRVAWIDGPTNVTVREPVVRILDPWTGPTSPIVDPEVIDAATRAYFSW